MPARAAAMSNLALTLQKWSAFQDPTWYNQLRPDPETDANAPNHKSRQVRAGHYVPVKPVPLPNATSVIINATFAEELGFDKNVTTSSDFVKYFSGDSEVLPEMKAWCTPYALAIMGSELTDNCPYGNGNGYGDGICFQRFYD